MIKEKILKKHDIHPLLQERWSPRVFSDQAVQETEIQLLLEAGRWAPSSSNVQPWRIIWGAKGGETYNRIFECLDPFNQKWAGNAPVLMLAAFKKTKAEGKENFHALHDLGAFSAHLTFQAQSMGIAVHQMAGVKHEEAHAEFEFTNDYHVATALAIGYYGGDSSDLPEDLQKIETPTSERKTRSAFAFNGNFHDDPKNISEEN